jgi:O-acetyl-ADP-ribose deacetylase (regulator of RNase III)
MIQFKQGNLLAEKTEALVNTVNCVGVMGKGIALQFKQAFPENFRQYEKACRGGQVKLGEMFIVATESIFYPRYIINFPTKNHWRGKSQIADIQKGLKSLISEVKKLGITSIAIPPLGCGNGGLNWADVQPLIESAFTDLPEVQVIVFTPQGSPEADQIRVGTTRPKMTRARALFIQLLELYGIPGYRLTLLEVQKLAYFLQIAGEPLKLRYVKHKYGPYAENLNHVLQRIEGHFIRGYGDRSHNAQIYLLPEGREEAKTVLATIPEANERLERVSELIIGFETPYGMEMLASIHWVVQETPDAAEDCELAIKLVQDWNDRKRDIFKPRHLGIAWHRLHEQNWFTGTRSRSYLDDVNKS